MSTFKTETTKASVTDKQKYWSKFNNVDSLIDDIDNGNSDHEMTYEDDQMYSSDEEDE
jgi:hypothetical protein